MALQDKQVFQEAFRFILGSTLLLHLSSNIFLALVEPVSNSILDILLKYVWAWIMLNEGRQNGYNCFN